MVWGGYAIAVLGPPALGYDLALNAAGTIGTASGLLFVAAVLYRRWSRSISVIPGQAEGLGPTRRPAPKAWKPTTG